MAIQMTCVDKDAKNEQWSLDLDGETVTVRNAAGETAAEYTHDIAAEQFRMPSFSESIKYLGINMGDGMRQFQVDKAGIKQIEQYLLAYVVAAGPEAVNAMKNVAIRDTIIGVALAIVGVVITVMSYQAAANNPEGGSYTITYGLVLFGLIMFGKGIYGFIQWSQMKSMAEKER